MGRFLLTVTVLFVLVASAYSLKCYSCVEFGKEADEANVCSKSEMDANENKYVMDCGNRLDTCMRSYVNALDIHTVTASCTTKAGCDTVKKACENGDDCGVSCCTEDKCNAGSSVSFSVLLMAVCSVLGLALLK